MISGATQGWEVESRGELVSDEEFVGRLEVLIDLRVHSVNLERVALDDADNEKEIKEADE